MATTRYATRSNALVQGKMDSENADSHLAGKGMVGKTQRTFGTRGAMTNVNALATNNVPAKAGFKPGAQLKPTARPGLTSNVNDKKKPVLSSRQAIKPKEVKELKPPSPTPMDISTSEEAYSRKLIKDVEDIDKDDGDNPQLVSEYVKDIYEYMLKLEARHPVRPKYLEGSDLNGRMRGILVDWLVQVHLRFHLLPETLYLTVAIIDRYLQVQPVSKAKLQLVGVTAMLVASKYEEMYAPEVNDFVYITDNAYTRSDILRMEVLMLKQLTFDLGRPLPLHFLRRNSKAGEVDADKHSLAKYLMELTLVDYECVHYAPSMVAAAGLCLAMRLIDQSEWTETLQHYSAYTEEQLEPLICRIAYLVQRAGVGKQTAIKAKYAATKFVRISTLPELSGPLIAELAAKVR